MQRRGGSNGRTALGLVLCALAIPARLTSQGIDRELACRGGPGISFEVQTDPSPRDSTRVVMLMKYRPSTKVMGERDYKALDPGTCTWNSRRHPALPPEPGRARVDVRRNAQPWFAQSRTLDTAITAAARYSDVNSLPRYLSDPRFYYSFYINDSSLLSEVHGALYDTTSGRFVTLSGPSTLPPGTRRDIRCRGGASGLLFGGGGSVGANLVSVTLSYRVSANVPGAGGAMLSPGSCAWVDRTGVPKEPGTITFTTAGNAQLKQAQSGGGIDRSVSAAERWPDLRTIPAYLQDSRHFWTFHVAVDQPTKAITHGAWILDPGNIAVGPRSTSTPTTRSTPSRPGSKVFTPGGAGTTSAATTVFDIKNVSVTPGLEGVAIRFDAAPGAKPTVTITPEAGGAPIPLAVGSVPNGTHWRYSAASTTTLARDTRYAYRIDAPATANARANSRTGAFKTLGQYVEIVINRIDVLSDGDASGNGELAFEFPSCPRNAIVFGYLPGTQDWGEGRHPVSVTLKSSDGKTPDRFRVVAYAYEDDLDSAMPFEYRRSIPRFSCLMTTGIEPGRNEAYEWNSALLDFDLTTLPGTKAGTSFVRRSKMPANGSTVSFEVRGSILVTRQ